MEFWNAVWEDGVNKGEGELGDVSIDVSVQVACEAGHMLNLKGGVIVGGRNTVGVVESSKRLRLHVANCQ